MQKVLKVVGMTCQHCVETVNDKVGQVAGVGKVIVSLEQKEVTVEFDESQTQIKDISDQIIAAGFEIITN